MGEFVWGSFADELKNLVKKASVKAVENNKRVDAQILYFIKGKCRTVASKCEDSFSITIYYIGDNVDDWYVAEENFEPKISTILERIKNLIVEELGLKVYDGNTSEGIKISWRRDDDNE